MVKAADLIGLDGVHWAECDQDCYLHFFFDQHEIVFAEGAPTESFRPGRRNMRSMDTLAREEILSIFPELRTDPEAVRPARLGLKGYEAQLLLN